MITKAIISIAVRLYPLMVRLYPRPFREEFAEEMTAVFHQAMQAAFASGWQDVLAVLGRELRDWPLNCLREHVWERNHQLLPRSSFLSRWGVVAAALPFCLLYAATFIPALPRYFLLLFLFTGVLVAWWQRWPGWVVSWLGFLIVYGQNWLPYSLFINESAWNTIPRLLAMLSEVAIQTGWLVVMYWVVRRWPRHGTLLFLPFLILPWAFSMEFASEAMTAVVFSTAFFILALTAAAISIQHTASGDIWLMYGGALLVGALLSLGAAIFSPGMENAWRMMIPNLLQALTPFVAILLLQSLNAWSRENGRFLWQQTRWMTAGTLLAFMAVLALSRLIGPSSLESFQIRMTPLLLLIWLVGVLFVLVGGWRLRSHFTLLGKGHLVVVTVMLVLLPLLYRPTFLSSNANSLVYQHPTLSPLREFVPTLQITDSLIAIVGIVGLLLLPQVIGRLRQQTTAFPTAPAPVGLKVWVRHKRENREANGRSQAARSLPKRLMLLLILTILLASGLFFGAVFLPLQLEAEPYTQQIALGDLDGDGDLDAVLANTMRLLPNADNKILTNDGYGRFSDEGRTIGQGGTSVVLLDSDADSDLDVVMGGMMGGIEYRNEGNGRFVAKIINVLQLPESGASQIFFQSGDVNNDNIADLFMAGCCGTGISRGEGEMEWVAPVNRVLFGGDAGLVDSGQQLGFRGSQAVALGDVDGDGDLDAFVGNSQSNGQDTSHDEPNELWLNDGNGHFSDSGQLFGRQRTYAVALGDVDGDGDLDALVGNEGADELWLNDGHGRFNLSEQPWSKRRTQSVFLSDLDGDGDLDAVTGHQVSGSFAWWRQGLVWWNNGSGHFRQGWQRIRYRPNAALIVNDINGDGLPDIACGAPDEVTVWFNDGNGRFVFGG